jgi:iron(III) transport system substrate-binding protein
MSRKSVVLMLVIAALVMASCGTPQPTPVPTAVPTQPPAPTTAPTKPPAPTAAPTTAPTVPPTPLESVIEGAKKEGKLVVYSSFDPTQEEVVYGAFKAKYPFLAIETVMLGSSAGATRVSVEGKAGTIGADVLLTGVNFAQPLVKDNLAMKIDWAGLGVGKQAVDGPYMVTVASITFPLTWNTGLVSTDKAPKTWEDMLKPEWSDEVGIWISGEYFAYLVPTWGEAKVDDYVAKLMQNKPVAIPQQPAVFDMLAAGEVSLAVGGNEGVLTKAAQRGAPVAGIWADPVPAVRYDCLIPTLAGDSNAGKLFCSWLASPEGAAAYEKATGRGNIFVEGSNLAVALKGKQISTFGADEMDKASALMSKYVKMIQQ